ncbi:MAG: hypothetical protein F6K25_21995 [Okeania sp. SIO2G4]|uniref:hypothetical protein n=1 Tax=unclassified Okeania TaxID=2634635 RepID=UPI0013BA93BF|nr:MULTISPECIES: hypothetical protein [unclassified Okeania]NEP72912.1 hypothetical protein [Okeania sp. SIO2G5]NEP93722.1 hypothetical protein [Okeania sp. SIO2F5]NEQ93190.1 hypothetical protein [Okeania sp. SIO2G4]
MILVANSYNPYIIELLGIKQKKWLKLLLVKVYSVFMPKLLKSLLYKLLSIVQFLFPNNSIFQISVGDAENADFSCLRSIPQGSADSLLKSVSVPESPQTDTIIYALPF